jgi:transposase
MEHATRRSFFVRSYDREAQDQRKEKLETSEIPRMIAHERKFLRLRHCHRLCTSRRKQRSRGRTGIMTLGIP